MAGRLAERCAAWVKEREPAELRDVCARVSRESAAIGVPTDPTRLPGALAATRTELHALATARATIERAPVTVAEARARMLAVLEDARGGFAFSVAHFFAADYDEMRGYVGPGSGMGVVPLIGDPNGGRAFVIQLLSEQLRQTVLTLLDREAERHGEHTLSPSERTRRLAAVEAKIHAAALGEERLVLALEAAGAPVSRREDCDPAVVLGTVAPEVSAP